ncbi:hypothetical protein Z043_119222 [Scleropages formosus]|uniref:Domain of unknown function with conserved HDNR motif domain-containing protein n=1 Tax=Scleropages formosus TaxID=113540 RepID=A0A0P7WNC3_SCLFO|nr:hypothetical protein Z043_119222 [Scleropages formosus]
MGRKKFLDDRRQHNSDVSFLAQGDSSSLKDWRQSFPTYLSDYRGHGKTESPGRRRFPRNHLERSKDAAVQAIEDFMFGVDSAKKYHEVTQQLVLLFNHIVYPAKQSLFTSVQRTAALMRLLYGDHLHGLQCTVSSPAS